MQLKNYHSFHLLKAEFKKNGKKYICLVVAIALCISPNLF